MSSMVWQGLIQMNPGTSFDDYHSFREKMFRKDRDPLWELKECERRLNADDGDVCSTSQNLSDFYIWIDMDISSVEPGMAVEVLA